MSGKEDYDSDAPEEFTQEQAIREDKELRKVQKENKARIIREGKERRRQWAQRKTPRSEKSKNVQDLVEPEETLEESQANKGMLPSNIVELLAAREKQVFSSDSEEDDNTEAKPRSRKKKQKSSGVKTVIFKEIPPPECLKSSLDFLKKRKMQVSRSPAVLINSNQALRLVSSTLTQKR